MCYSSSKHPALSSDINIFLDTKDFYKVYKRYLNVDNGETFLKLG